MFSSVIPRLTVLLIAAFTFPATLAAQSDPDRVQNSALAGGSGIGYAGGDEISTYFRMMWGLLIVLALMLAIYALVRKRFSLLNSKSGKSIRVVEIQPVMPKKSLCLVEVRGKEYLIGIGNDNISMLAALDEPSPSSFEDALKDSQVR